MASRVASQAPSFSYGVLDSLLDLVALAQMESVCFNHYTLPCQEYQSRLVIPGDSFYYCKSMYL